jgi:hypothetical protein
MFDLVAIKNDLKEWKGWTVGATAFVQSETTRNTVSKVSGYS